MVGAAEQTVVDQPGRIARSQFDAEARRVAVDGKLQGDVAGSAVDPVNIKVCATNRAAKRDLAGNRRDHRGAEHRPVEVDPVDDEPVDAHREWQAHQAQQHGERRRMPRRWAGLVPGAGTHQPQPQLSRKEARRIDVERDVAQHQPGALVIGDADAPGGHRQRYRSAETVDRPGKPRIADCVRNLGGEKIFARAALQHHQAGKHQPDQNQQDETDPAQGLGHQNASPRLT